VKSNQRVYCSLRLQNVGPEKVSTFSTGGEETVLSPSLGLVGFSFWTLWRKNGKLLALILGAYPWGCAADDTASAGDSGQSVAQEGDECPR
jgi:hypothetical protein